MIDFPAMSNLMDGVDDDVLCWPPSRAMFVRFMIAMRSTRYSRAFFGVLLFLGFAAGCTVAQAQWLEHLDVVPQDGSADIVIRFGQNVLYKNHAPKNEGKILRISLRIIDGEVPDAGFAEDTLWTPKFDGIPSATVTFSHTENSILVTFSQVTKYSVRPGSDGRSIIVSVPRAPTKEPVSKTPVSVPASPVTAAQPTAPEATQAPQAAITPSPAVVPQAPATLAATAAEATSTPAAPVQSAAEVEQRAEAFMQDAHRALSAKDGTTAINRLNRVLGLPTNGKTEEAQALIGEAREMNGELQKARAEDELYLKLFPNGKYADRVRARLAAIPKGETAARAARVRMFPKEAGPAQWSYFGSISAYYYTGKSQIDTLTAPPPGQLTFNQATLSLVDQNSLITSVNLNARRRDAFSDTRIVFRDTDNRNYLDTSRNYNRLYSAYVEHNNRKDGYYLRLGRQNPNGMGVLERFDGLQLGYNLTPRWRVNAVYGDAVEFDSPYKKIFYGASVDLLPEAGRPGASVYAINQTLDGWANRRAVGTEVRYFDGHLTAYGTLDYDVLFGGINIALFQGNYLSDRGTNYFVVIDHRRAPSYSLTNALPATVPLSLNDAINIQGLEAVRDEAKALTAISDMFGIGFTHPVSDRWQLGADYRLSEISRTEDVVAVIPLAAIGTCLGTIDFVNNTCLLDTASQQGTGKNHVVTLQAIGTNLFATNAVGVASVSFIAAPTYHGQSYSLNYVLPIRERWRIDTNLRYYTQHDNMSGGQDRTSGSVKLSYQWRNSLYLEAEVGEEVSNNSSTTQSDHTKRDYFYGGVRWDFH
jgi:hypothetical protein